MKNTPMTNGRSTVMGLLRVPLRAETKENKSLLVMQSLQVQHDRFLCNYSDMSTSSKINSSIEALNEEM